jgi:hypothetical protein
MRGGPFKKCPMKAKRIVRRPNKTKKLLLNTATI